MRDAVFDSYCLLCHPECCCRQHYQQE
jgi:hypothetical protein